MRNKVVKVGISWSLGVKGAHENIIDGLIVKKHNNISVLLQGVSREDEENGGFNDKFGAYD